MQQAHDLAADTLRSFVAELDARAPGAADVGLWALLGEVMDCLASAHGVTAADVMERVQERLALAPLQPAPREDGRAELRCYDDPSGWRVEIEADSVEDGRALAALLRLDPAPAIRLRHG
ncbi:hypothetical protein [Falsiroseomonas oryzae]|uniref:hypothetical protein n=1 Tax=Falsiroseomonas oryzae TaxID=2766473 RepID=UPI0022EACEDD|nr:hypothetical protein [Roseomonas sp. MO-31]